MVLLPGFRVQLHIFVPWSWKTYTAVRFHTLFHQVLVNDGFGRDVRQSASSTTALSVPAFRFLGSQSPLPTLEADVRTGLPPSVHRLAEPPIGLPAPFGPLSPPAGALPPPAFSQEGTTPQMPVQDTPAALNLPLASLRLSGEHVLSVSSFARDQLHQLFNIAHAMRAAVQRGRSLETILKVRR